MNGGRPIEHRRIQPIPEPIEKVGLMLLAAFLLPGLFVQAISLLQSLGPFFRTVNDYVVLLVMPAVFIGLPVARVKWLRGGPASLGLHSTGIGRHVMLGMLFGLIVFLSNSVFSSISVDAAGWLIGNEAAQMLSEQEQNRSAALFSVDNTWFTTFFIMFVLSIVTPIAEEIFFRGYVYSALRHHWGVPASLLASAAIFSVFHFYIIQLLPIFVAGLFFGWLYERTGSIVPSIVAHAVVNGVVAGFLLFQSL